MSVDDSPKIKKAQQLEQLEVSEENPFEHDALNREELCETLSWFIANAQTPFVLAVNAKWGDGKTWFLQMLQGHLEKQKFTTVFFDAWKCDFYKDALPTLVKEIESQLASETSKDTVKNLRKRANKLIKLVWRSKNIFLQQLPEESIPIFILRKIINMIIKVVEPTDVIKNYQGYQETVEDFKEALKEATAQLKKRPLVIFVDELDRCRPTFAIEVLEKIKHIFDVKNIFFVVAVNKKEFVNTIQSQYGMINGDDYLQKFFDATIQLQNDPDYSEELIGRYSQNVGLKGEILGIAYRVLPVLFTMFQVTLRQQEQIIFSLALIFQRSQNLHQNPFYTCTTLFLASLKIINPPLFGEINASFEPKITEQQDMPVDKVQALFPQYIQEEAKNNISIDSAQNHTEHIKAHIYIANMVLLIAVASTSDTLLEDIETKLGIDQSKVHDYLDTYFYEHPRTKVVGHLHELLKAINLV